MEAVPTREAARPDVTQAIAFEALKADVGRQVQAPRPRALGGLVVMDVFTREAAVEPLQNKNAETVGRPPRAPRGS